MFGAPPLSTVPLISRWCLGEGWCPGEGRGRLGEAGHAVKGEVGGGCGEAAGAASGDGASGDAGDADTPAPPPPAGGDVRLNDPPPICTNY